jgi:hypothetical protein
LWGLVVGLDGRVGSNEMSELYLRTVTLAYCLLYMA